MTYFICIFPLSVARWLFYSGYKVKYQGTLFTTTLFSLSGTFNAILFFVTRPDLVVGSSSSPSPAPAVDIQLQASHDGELATPSSWKLGSVPSSSPVASDYVSPDLEMDYNGQFDPYNLMLVANSECANSHISASPRRMESKFGCYSGERTHGDIRLKPVPTAQG